jgi:uncharacterized protein YjbJ (UPF0337 family)
VGLDELKGKAKEAVGNLTGSDGLRDEGQAQQHKAAEQRLAQDAQEVADWHTQRAEEISAGERQRAEQAQEVADEHAANAEARAHEEARHQGT